MATIDLSSTYDPAAFATEFSQAGIDAPTAANLSKVAELQSRILGGETLGSASQAFYDRFAPAYQIVYGSAPVQPGLSSVSSTDTTLTPEVATSLMQRSMTTGVPTREFDKYGGYEAVRQMYDQAGGTYDISNIPQEQLQSYADIVSQTGVGNLGILEQAGKHLTPGAFLQMEYAGIDPNTIAQLKQSTYEDLTNELYNQYLGRAPEADVASTFAAGNKREKDIISALRESSEYQNRLQGIVQETYQDVLGHSGDPEGVQYWADKLKYGELTPDTLGAAVAQAAIPLATTAEERIALQRYLGQQVYAPEELLTRTGGLGYQEIVDYIAQNIDDPTKVYQRAQEFNVNPNDVLAAMQAKGATELKSLSDIESFFNQGREGFGERYNQIVEDTFGNDEERARIEQILGLQPGDLEKIYDPSQFSRSSIERIEETLQSGRINKIQDALIAKAIAKDALGYSDTEVQTMVSDLIEGKEDDPILKDIFNSLKSGNRMTSDEFDQVMKKAAKENPDAEVFKRDPELKVRYTPIEATQGRSGQYGYWNDAPILYAPALDKYLKGSNKVKLDLGKGDLGWATNSKYMGEIRNGAALFGVTTTPQQINEMRKVDKIVEDAGGLVYDKRYRSNGIYTEVFDPESGQKVKTFVPENVLYQMVSGYNPESGAGTTDYEVKNTRKQLESAAEKLNIDPTKFDTVTDLYDAVQNASKDLYMVVGRANGWDKDIARKSGITVTDGSRGGVNHAAVVYKKVGDKAIAIQTPKSFGFDDPKQKSFWQEIASIPFVAELSLLNPVTAAWYPAIKGVQTAVMGGDTEDILKNVALSWTGQNVIPNLAPELTANIGNQLLEAGISPDIAGTLADAGARVALNTGMSALAGADIGEAAERSLLSYAAGKGISGGLSLTDFPKEFQPDVARLLTEGVISGNFEQAAKNAVMRYGGTQLKNIIKDADKPMSGGPTLQAARGGLAQASQLRRVPRRVAPIRRDVRKLIPLRKSGLAYFRT